VPFISRGRTIGFRRVNKYSPLESILREFAKKGFIGRFVFDGTCKNVGNVILRIEVISEKIVAMEAEAGGKLLKGREALEVFEACKEEAEGFVEIIELDSDKVLIDLEDNPDARVNLVIEMPTLTLKIAALHVAAKGSGLALVGTMLKDVALSECLVAEGLIDGRCDGVIKGEMCPDKIDLVIAVKESIVHMSRPEEVEGSFVAISEKCKMAEFVMKATKR